MKPGKRIKQIVGASSWSVVGLFSSLITGVLTARLLVPEGRGVVALMITTASLGYLVTALGTNISIRTFLHKDGRANFENYRAASMRLLVPQVLVMGAGGLLLWKLNKSADLSLWEVLILVALGVTTFISNQLLDALNALGKISNSAFANTLGMTSVTVSLSFFAFTNYGTIATVLSSYLLGFIVRILYSRYSLAGDWVRAGEGVTRDGGRFLMRRGIGLMGFNLGQALSTRVDQYVLAAIAGPYSVGIFVVAVTPASLVQVVSNSIGQVMLRDAARNRLSIPIILKYSALSLAVSCIYAIFLWNVSPWLIPLIYGESYEDAINVVRVLVLGELFAGVYLIHSRIMVGLGQSRVINIGAIIMLGTNLTFLFMFVPVHGVMGAAWASVGTYTIMFLYMGLALVNKRKSFSNR